MHRCCRTTPWISATSHGDASSARASRVQCEFHTNIDSHSEFQSNSGAHDGESEQSGETVEPEVEFGGFVETGETVGPEVEFVGFVETGETVEPGIEFGGFVETGETVGTVETVEVGEWTHWRMFCWTEQGSG